MLETTHALVAGAIAAHTNDPLTAVSLSYVSHFMLDAIPHWDFGTNWRGRRKLFTGIVAIADVALGFSLGYLIFKSTVSLPVLFACITAAMLPDWMEAPWYMFFATKTKKEPGKQAGLFEKMTYGVYKIENIFHKKTTFFFGISTQIIAVLFFFFLLK